MVATKRQLVSGNFRLVNRGTNDRIGIAVHQTGNTSRGANAQAHANLQSNGNSRRASWHWQVDDRVAIQSYLHSARCWHAGDGSGIGNNGHIAVEICINSDGNYKKALQNAAELIAQIMLDEGIPLSRVRQHNYFSGKNCPRQIRAGQSGVSWAVFLQMVADEYAKLTGKETSTPTPPKTSVGNKSVSTLANEVIQGLHGNGDARRRSLGDQFEAVQAEVNRRLAGTGSKAPKKQTKSISELAREVIDGKHGNGDARKNSLGSNYAAVQREVNRILAGTNGGTSRSKTIAQLASEVILGKHGNGAQRKRSLGSNYAAVQREVNRRLR